jgi:16S rRNA (guanine527-N7)-methyltransferase
MGSRVQGKTQNSPPRTPPCAMDKFNIYKELVKKYHQTLDLVSDVALEHFDDKIVDSLFYAELIKSSTKPGAIILDVGSGAGLPGLVLAIALPENPIFLVERRQKRAAFLKIAVSQLKLTNAKSFSMDVTELGGVSVDVITAMAVGSFKLLYCLTRHLHAEKVILMSRKGDNFYKEIEELEQIPGMILKLLSPHPPSNTANVSRETIYGNLVAVEVLGGLECAGL